MSNQKKIHACENFPSPNFPHFMLWEKTKTFPNIGTCHALKFILRYWEYAFKLIIMFKKRGRK
jgi:hypothetical protein